MEARVRLDYLITTAPNSRTTPPTKLQTLLFAFRLEQGPRNVRIEEDESGHYLNFREPRQVAALDQEGSHLAVLRHQSRVAMYFVPEELWPELLKGAEPHEVSTYACPPTRAVFDIDWSAIRTGRMKR